MYEILEELHKQPEPFEVYTTPEMWNDPYVSKQMLKYHLMKDVDLASRNTEFIDRSAKWIINKLNIGKGISVCDFGCGPGLYATRFAKTVADVTGIDLSESSINYAKNESEKDGLSINYVLANYLDYETHKKYDVITIIFCDFCVLNPEQAGKLLGKFSAMLKPGGRLLMDVSTPAYFKSVEVSCSYERSERDGFWSADTYHVFNRTFKYAGQNLVLNKHVVFEDQRIRTFYNWLQCYSLDELKSLVSKHGLEIKETFANVAGDKLKEDSTETAMIIERV